MNSSLGLRRLFRSMFKKIALKPNMCCIKIAQSFSNWTHIAQNEVQNTQTLYKHCELRRTGCCTSRQNMSFIINSAWFAGTTYFSKFTEYSRLKLQKDFQTFLQTMTLIVSTYASTAINSDRQPSLSHSLYFVKKHLDHINTLESVILFIK